MEELWRAYRASLASFIRRRVADEATADDILQEVFIKMQSGLPSLQDRTRLRSWLYRMARNAIIDHFRAQKPAVDLPEWLAQPETDRGEAARRELAECLGPMIRQLPDKYREAVVLSELHGMPQREVAKLQGITLSGAKSRIQRGRALLKEMLVDCCRLQFDGRGRLYDYEKRRKGANRC